MINRFRQFRIDKLSVDQINREFDLVRVALQSISSSIVRGGSDGADGADGERVWELEFSMGYRGVGSNIIDYITPDSDGYFWFTPDTKAETTSVDDIFHIAEWRPDREYSNCCLVLDVNDINLGVHVTAVDIFVVKNSVPTTIGQAGMTSGAYHIHTDASLSVSDSDTVGLRCKVYHNPSYPGGCPGPDSTINMTAKIILT